MVEPDVRNTAGQALNEAVGFQVVHKVAKPEKVALLSVRARAQFRAATATTARSAEGGAR